MYFELTNWKRTNGDGRQRSVAQIWMVLFVLLCACFMAQQARAAGVVQWQLDKSVYTKSAPIKASFQNIATPSSKHWVGIWAYPDSGTRAGAWDRASNGGQSSLKWAYLPATADNPKGYWERVDVMHLHDWVLQELDSNWCLVANLDVPWKRRMAVKSDS